MTQEYFTTFLEKDFVLTADRERGKFRTFVLVTVNRFLTKQLTRRSKREARLNIVITSYSIHYTKLYDARVKNTVSPLHKGGIERILREYFGIAGVGCR